MQSDIFEYLARVRAMTIDSGTGAMRPRLFASVGNLSGRDESSRRDAPIDTRRFGVIGGLGTPASLYYHEKLIQFANSEHASANFLIANANFCLVKRLSQAGDRQSLAGYFASLVKDLRSAGVKAAAISAVMPHICLPELQEISPLPILDIVDAIKQRLLRDNLSRVALLGSRVTMETHLFGRLTEFELVDLTDAEMDEVQRIYTSAQISGRATDGDRRLLRSLCEELQSKRGAQAIVIGGTDLASSFQENEETFPIVNAARVHVEAILAWAIA